MNINYVIIQAGGKGTRLKKYTLNKPKALLSVDGIPLIFNIMETFDDSFYIVIGDYKYDILKNYLRKFCKKKYIIIKSNEIGTCSGLKKAIDYIPENEPFIITWCDLYFGNDFSLPSLQSYKNYIGISSTFECRWSFIENKFVETPSMENGVAGFFVFSNKSLLNDLPREGEFVRYLSEKNIQFDKIILKNVTEFGTLEKYEEYILNSVVSRPFNKIEIKDNRVIKIPITKKGIELSFFEKDWYKHVSKLGYENIPKIYNWEPLEIEKIEGRHPFELSISKEIIYNIVEALRNLHSLDSYKPVNFASVYKEYYQKTFERLYEIKDLLPFSDKKELRINNRNVLNPFFIEEEIKSVVEEIYPKHFSIIHGDPTFSNILIDYRNKIYFIDPRGYFGYTKLYGDLDYDYAKFYYSLVGNYDMFNRKKFDLKIHERGGDICIFSIGGKKYEDLFWYLVGEDKKFKIKLLNGIIWLSLTTYVWDDYDMICGAFLNGTLLLNEVLYK